MGLWDLELEQDVLKRKACGPMLKALRDVHAQRGADVGRGERKLRLIRSGNVPFEFVGRLVWQRVRPNAHAIRVFRRDRPDRLWVIALTVRSGKRTVNQVRTAAELDLMIEEAIANAPGRSAFEHGINGPRFTRHTRDPWWRTCSSSRPRRT